MKTVTPRSFDPFWLEASKHSVQVVARSGLIGLSVCTATQCKLPRLY